MELKNIAAITIAKPIISPPIALGADSALNTPSTASKADTTLISTPPMANTPNHAMP